MSRKAVIVSDAEDSRALCRLCMIYHEYVVNIFIPNNLFRICAEEAIHDLLSLKVAVGDGLPSNICHQCVNKLMEFRDFKEMCLKTAAELRRCDLDNFLRVSKIKDEVAGEMETSREGGIQENTVLNNIQVTEVYITTAEELAIRNVSIAKEELWSTDNALVVKEEDNDGEHRIEGDVPMNVLTSVAVDPLTVDTMALKEETQEPKVAAGKGNSLGDSSPHNHIRVTEVFVPFPEELAKGIVRYAEVDSRPTELIVKEEIGEGLECSENDVPVGSLSSVDVDPLAVDTTVNCGSYIGRMPEIPEIYLDKFGSGRDENSLHQLPSNSSCDHMREKNLQYEYSTVNSPVPFGYSEEIVKRKQNFRPSVSSKNCSLSNNLKRFKCDPCGMSFQYSSELKNRSVIHTGVKPHRCDVCGKMFPQKWQLKRHSLTHTGVKPFECNVCGKHFADKSNLKQHLVIHTGEKPFICNECGKNFRKKSHLKEHLVIHTGVKPFECNVCGKYFTDKRCFKKHLLVHTEVNPLNCNV